MAKNIADTFVEVAKKFAGRTAIIETRTTNSVSFAELNRRADGYANYFLKNGIRTGDKVILMVGPSIEFICLTLALFKLGSPIVLIDPGMGYKNLLRCIGRVEPNFLVGIPKALLFARFFPKAFRTVGKSFCCGFSSGLFGSDIRSRWKEDDTPYPVYEPAVADLAAIIFTTGSTGPPKGVRYEHSIFSAQLRLIKDYYKIGPEDIDQPGFPLFGLFSSALGACTVIPDMDPTRPARVRPEKFVSSISKYQVTYSFGSPAIWNVVSNYCLEKGVKLKSLKKVLMAGAPVPHELVRRVAGILPSDAQIFTPYGATESLPVVSIEGREVLTETWKRSSRGMGTCVGRALPGIDVKVIAISEAPIPVLHPGMEVAIGEIGEIIVRGDVVTRGYFGNPDEDRLAKIEDGDTFWHRMGDVGYLDGHNRLWFCGRRAHRVVTARTILFTVPCEAIINEHAEVFRSALVGIKAHDRCSAMIPVMVVEPMKIRRLSNLVLLAEVKKMAAENTLTADIQHFLIHEDFPVDIRHNAKIFREQLAEWARTQLYP